jgi:hypothetical protein
MSWHPELSNQYRTDRGWQVSTVIKLDEMSRFAIKKSRRMLAGTFASERIWSLEILSVASQKREMPAKNRSVLHESCGDISQPVTRRITHNQRSALIRVCNDSRSRC